MEPRRDAFDVGQIAVARLDARFVFDFVAHDVERAIDGVVQVYDFPHVVHAAAREILEVLHDVFDAQDAVARLGEERDDIAAQKFEINAFAQRTYAS